MNSMPERWGDVTEPKFSKQEIKNRSFIEAKNRSRENFEAKRSLDLFSKIEKNDLPENLVDNPSALLLNINEMDQKKLLSAALPKHPWSGYYWPLIRGQIAYRYSDPNFPTDSWKDADKYIRDPDNFSSLNKLSPAEKYDLLFSENERPLTRRALAEGGKYYRADGDVEPWMGICHGWAPASFMMDRPTHSVKVLAADGKSQIIFYPSDIKALASLLWAEGKNTSRLVGGRCKLNDPEQSAEGRIISQDCFDTNPGTWHTAIVNQIGINKRSFVMDATYDYEVWNQPILSYTYSYFNPQTKSETDLLSDAVVKAENFTRDKFKRYRSAEGYAFVGIAMNVTYMVETRPNSNESDRADSDATKTVRYLYDLELDASGKIIGGEWYLNTHPDFLWVPPVNEKATTSGDMILTQNGSSKLSWKTTEMAPIEWKDAARKSALDGTPLAVIVEALINFSNLPEIP